MCVYIFIENAVCGSRVVLLLMLIVKPCLPFCIITLRHALFQQTLLFDPCIFKKKK